MAAKQMASVEGRRIALSNLDKVLYPAAAFTKAHVLDYYLRVAPVLLPHYKNRPITMRRFPDGVGGQSFYEKDAPSYKPAWVKTHAVPRKVGGEPIQYILVNDAATLVWCANLASLEFHPFLHRAPRIDQPREVVFDLDPGEGLDIAGLARVALELRDVLSGLGLESWPKSSGSKGLQVYVPLNGAYTYDDTQAFSRWIARLMAEHAPDRVVAQMTKSLRAGRVFIDWSQNSDFKTTVGVYSLRAKADVPYVSAPVAWEEVEACAKPARRGKQHSLLFTPEETLKRVEAQGDLFAPVLERKQRLPAAAKPGRSQAS